MYDSIEKPLDVGPLHLARRVYLPAHQPGLASSGRPTAEYIAYHRARARAGATMQVTGATPVRPSDEWADICLWNVDDSIVPGYRALADAVHAEGGHILAQLAHPGPTETEGREVIGASLDFSEVSQQVAVPATTEQLATIVDDYAAAAARCAEGGLDGVEISMAHGLLLAAFLSPLLNVREDEYGGSFENTLRLPREVLRAVRAAIRPTMALGIRLGADDLVPGGMTPELAARVAEALEAEVDYISVMVGNNNRREARVRHWAPTPMPPGAFREIGRAVTERVNVPVAIVGRILDLELANDIVESGDADIVGIVRAQIADARLIPLSLADRASEVRPCIGSNICVDTLLSGKPLRCMVNPDVGGSRDLTSLPSLNGRTALVAGGGPAGLEAARRLASRGAAVSLVERSGELGGALRHWTRSTSRREFRRIIEWQEDELARLGVSVALGTAFSPELIDSIRPDWVISAVGSETRGAAIPGDDSIPALRVDRITGSDIAGKRILVHDLMGRLNAVWVAEHLAEEGATPILTTSRLHIGEGEGVSTLYPALRRIGELGLETHSALEPVRVASGRVTLAGAFGGPEREIACDAIIHLDVSVPRALVLEASVPVVAVGDAVRPRDVTSAFADARELTDDLR